MAVCPMGWTWSLHLAQLVNGQLFEGDTSLSSCSKLSQLSPAPVIRENDTGRFAYVDDSGILGVTKAVVDALHLRYKERAESHGLCPHEKKSHGGIVEDIKFGFRVDGVGLLVEPKDRKWIYPNAKRRFKGRP